MMTQQKAIPRSRTWRSGSTGDLTEIGARLVNQSTPVFVPIDRSPRPICGDRSPRHNYACNRHAGHTGRHHFAHLHFDGRVREVWA